MSRSTKYLAIAAGAALRLAPSRFRSEYGPEVVAAFAAMLDAERGRRGRIAMGILWARGLADLVRTARAEGRSALPPSPHRVLGDLGDDVRAAVRSVVRVPGLSLAIIVTLVFGIGLASTIFAFGDGYLFRTLPYANPDDLYVVRDPLARREMLTAEDGLALKESALASLGFLEGMGSARVRSGLLQLEGRDVFFSLDGIDDGFAELLGVPMALGRHFGADAFEAGEPVPIWLTHKFWQREFGGDPGVIGRRYVVRAGQERTTVVIVGVTDPRITTFDLNFRRSNRLPDGFAPARPSARSTERITFLASPIVRLPSGMSIERAEAAIGARLQSASPRRDGRPRQVRLDSMQEEQVKSGRTTALLFVLGAALSLCLVTINLVHLLLTRSVTRAAELATRAALGASNWRVARLLLVESLTYAACGISGGLALAYGFLTILAATIPSRGSDAGSLAVITMQFDVRVVAFACTVGLGVALVGGGWPAWRATRRLATMGRAMPGSARADLSPRFSRVMLVSEVGVSTLVLLGAVFCGVGIWRFFNQPLGYELVDRYQASFPDAPQQATGPTDWPALRDAIAKVEGVRAVAQSLRTLETPVWIGSREIPEDTAVAAGVSADYFAAAGVQLIAGRLPDNEMLRATAPVAVVDERLARLGWPDGSAIGQVLTIDSTPVEVIGVISSLRFSLLRETPAIAFVPRPPRNERGGLRIWAPASDAGQLTERLYGIVARVAPGFRPRIQADTFEARFGDEIGNASFQRPILVVLGLFAFSVAGVGLFAVVSHLVERRTREFGIRLALGARATDVTRALAREAVAPACIGLGLGVASGAALQDAVRATMFGWESSGAMTVALVAVAILGVALLAAAIPAQRVMRIDPARSLRSD